MTAVLLDSIFYSLKRRVVYETIVKHIIGNCEVIRSIATSFLLKIIIHNIKHILYYIHKTVSRMHFIFLFLMRGSLKT